MARRRVIAMGLAALAACGGAPPAAPADPARGDVLVVAWGQDLGNLHPATVQTAQDAAVLGALQLPMFDGRFDCGMHYAPGAFETWEEDADGRGGVATLRAGLAWSDGRPVTAHDVVLTYALVRDPAVASPRAGHVQHLEPDSPSALDERRVRFRFTRAYDRTTQRSHTNLLPTPSHLFADADRASLRGHPRALDPVVDGPFRLALHEPGHRFVLEPNEAFTGPEALRPRLAKVVFQILPEYTTRLAKLRAGEVDLVEGLTLEDADALAASNPELRIASRGFRFVEFVAWNLAHPLFADLEVRRALALAVDVDGLIAQRLTSKDGTRHARRAIGTITPELCAAHADDVAPLAHDPTAARALLAARGWVDHDGDGWLDRDGQRFAFTLLTTAGNPRRAEVAVELQAAWKALGVDVRLETRELNAFYDTLRRREHEAALGGWSASLFLDPSEMWHSDTPGHRRAFNVTGFADAEVDRLIEQGLATPDAAQAAPLWRALQARVHAQQPYLFLWWTDDLVAIHRRFEHVDIGPLSALGHLEAWQVPPEARLRSP